VSGRRLLVATGAVVADVREVPLLVRGLIDAASDVFVITPMLPSRFQWWASDTDGARTQADERLNAVLGQMEELGLETSGRVGDDAPLTAFADAIRDFRPDHILIALRGFQHAGWQERGLVDRLRAEFHLPMTIFEIDAEGRVPGPGL
jgi:hypothetical protein